MESKKKKRQAHAHACERSGPKFHGITDASFACELKPSPRFSRNFRAAFREFFSRGAAQPSGQASRQLGGRVKG